MQLTWYGVNSWLFEMSGQRILVDPWLVGPLEFGGMTWMFRGVRQKGDIPLPEQIDLILLTQGIEDHAHPETLKQLDRSIPVVGSPKAAKLAKDLGFTSVTAVEPGDTHTFKDIEIITTEGALTGIKPENGYILSAPNDGRLYYEPHGFFPTSLTDYAPFDVAVGPMMNIALPLVGPIVKGKDSAIAIAKLIQPRYFLQTAFGEDGVVYEGMLNSILSASGGIDTFKEQLKSAGLDTEAIAPEVGKPVTLHIPSTVPS